MTTKRSAKWIGCLAVLVLGLSVLNTAYADPIVANFTFSPEKPENAPYTVTFTDTSTGGATSWYWDFGDSTTSIEQNPTHMYDSSIRMKYWD